MYVSVGDSFPEGGMYNDGRVVCTIGRPRHHVHAFQENDQLAATFMGPFRTSAFSAEAPTPR